MTTQIIQAKSQRDKENTFRFLYDIWSNELCRSMAGMDHTGRQMKDELDKTARHLLAIDDSGRILGCVRANFLSDTLLSDELSTALKTPRLIELFASRKICYASHFTVAPDARGKTVTSLLFKALYNYCLESGITVGISYCALHFIPFYYQLGYRPYTENFRVDSGIRVPILHCLCDRTYLTEIKSPLVRLCPDSIDDHGSTAGKISEHFPSFISPVFAGIKAHHLWARLAHFTPEESPDARGFFLAGLSEQERLLVSRRGSEITFYQGDYIFLHGEDEKGIGILLSGSLGVEVSMGETTRITSIILPGEPFGELHSLSGKRRTTSLVALEKSEAFLLPFDFLERVGCADKELGIKLTGRMLKILANRFVSFTTDSLYSTATAEGGVKTTQPASLPTDENSSNSNHRRDSYRFNDLGDREGELKRLINQASIGEDIEMNLLRQLGLKDGATVLDLGSGPGVTSMILAKNLPSSTIIGVEPDATLREKASSLLASQGFKDRCRLLDGTGEHIPLDNGAVDFCYARLLFQHLPNPLEVLKEMKRVSRPQGRLVVLDVDDRSNIVHPAPEGLAKLEADIAAAQAAAGGDRYVGRKLYGYLHQIGLEDINIELLPISAEMLGREAFFSIVYSFKRQVLERAGRLDDDTAALFQALEKTILHPKTFAVTTVFAARGRLPSQK